LFLPPHESLEIQSGATFCPRRIRLHRADRRSTNTRTKRESRPKRKSAATSGTARGRREKSQTGARSLAHCPKPEATDTRYWLRSSCQRPSAVVRRSRALPPSSRRLRLFPSPQATPEKLSHRASVSSLPRNPIPQPHPRRCIVMIEPDRPRSDDVSAPILIDTTNRYSGPHHHSMSGLIGLARTRCACAISIQTRSHPGLRPGVPGLETKSGVTFCPRRIRRDRTSLRKDKRLLEPQECANYQILRPRSS